MQLGKDPSCDAIDLSFAKCVCENVVAWSTI